MQRASKVEHGGTHLVKAVGENTREILLVPIPFWYQPKFAERLEMLLSKVRKPDRVVSDAS